MSTARDERTAKQVPVEVLNPIIGKYGEIDLSPQNREQALADLTASIRRVDNLSEEAAGNKAREIFRLLDLISDGKTTDAQTGRDPREELQHSLEMHQAELTGVEAIDVHVVRLNRNVDASLRAMDFETAYDSSSRMVHLSENSYVVGLVRELDFSRANEVVGIMLNVPPQEISARFMEWERRNEDLQVGEQVARAVQRIDAYNYGMANPNADVNDILAAVRSTTDDEFEHYARRFLTEQQFAAIQMRVADISEDTSGGSEAEQIMQETVKQAIEQLRSQMEDLQFSEELQEKLDEIIKEEESRKDEEKYATISERMPEGLAREIGTSEDAIEFLEMLSGVRSYDSARINALLSNNGGEIANGFYRFLAEG